MTGFGLTSTTYLAQPVFLLLHLVCYKTKAFVIRKLSLKHMSILIVMRAMHDKVLGATYQRTGVNGCTAYMHV